MVRRSHAHRLWIFTPLPSRVPTPPAWGSVTPSPLTRPTSWKGGRSARDRQGQLVSGRKAAAPLVPAFPLLASSSPQDPRPGLAARWNSPSGAPQPGGGGGGEQAQAGVGGNSPPRPPGPNSSESSDLPAAPAGCPKGVGGGQRRCVGERGREGGEEGRGEGKEMGGPEPQSPRCLAPQSSLPPLTRPPPRCPAWKNLSPPCQYPHSPCLSWKIGGIREDSRKPRVLLVVVGPLKTSAWKSVPQARGLPRWC